MFKIEKLETRRLLSSVSVSSQLGTATLGVTASGGTLELGNFFTNVADSSSTIHMATNMGPIDLQLRPDAAPLTVANFLNYVNSGAYNNSIFHRSMPGFVIQAGGFDTSGAPITANSPVQNEFNLSNVRGTVAMAKLGGDPNSATNQWFINLADNSHAVDPSTNIDNGLDVQNGGFTVFADVIDNTMSTADAIAALPTTSQFKNVNPAFTDLPLANSGQSLVVIENVHGTLTYAVTSDNPNVASATVTGTSLVVAIGNSTGTSHITVTATDPEDGSTVQNVLTVIRDETPPTAAVGSSAPQFASDNSNVTFTIVYTDDNAVKASTLGNTNIQVTGPNGFSQMATLVSTGLTDAGTITATYKVTGPGGGFTFADDGSYSVALQSGSVTDTAGNSAAAATLGSFHVNIAPPAPGPDLTSTITKVSTNSKTSATTLSPSSKNTLTFSIKNSGTALAKGKVPVKVMVGNTVVATLNENLNLKIGASKNFTTKFSSPNLAEGDYPVTLVVDDTDALHEQYTTNHNASAAANVHVIPPFVDLSASFAKLPSTLKAKGTVSVVITNNGSITAKGGSTIKLYAPATQTRDEGSLLVTLPKNLNIAPGKSLTVKIKLPSVIPSGSRFFEALVSYSADTDPSNNDVFSQSTVLLG